ncbi:MAG: A/G-specific adenine glycosylase [Deltaproteobacteria bacterium]|nr:A/G-specific adenine glycosylase [Deltaproteobacteria bacterium]
MVAPARKRDALPDLLLTWYRRARRDLPWRRTRDPYAIWLSEVMLQQTQVVTVIPYWHKFLARFPTVEALAAAELPEVLSMWSGLGYYSRARTLHRAANVIASAHAGKLPRTAEALRELPGFGPYTAGAVASIAFGQQTPIVDGNVVRVLARLFEIEGDPSSREVQKKIWALAGELVPSDSPGDFNQALMELGATVCTPKNPTCLLCPVRATCGALQSKRVDQLPSPKARAARKSLRRTSAIVLRNEKLLLGRRPDAGLFGGLWELPSVDGDRAALAAALGRGFTLGEAVATVERTLTHRDLSFELVRTRAPARIRSIAPYVELRWVGRDEARELGMATAMTACLEHVWPSAVAKRRKARR